MPEGKETKELLSELADNLGTIGLFMLGEVRAFLKKSWGASKEEFMDAVDQVSKTMKASGKMAAEDVERAAEQIKSNWGKLSGARGLEWDSFFDELQKRLEKMSDITQETFELAVEQAKKAVDAQWSALGRVGEDQLAAFRKYSEQMANAVKDQWSTFREQLEKTGKKIPKAVQAALDELKKKD